MNEKNFWKYFLYFALEENSEMRSCGKIWKVGQFYASFQSLIIKSKYKQEKPDFFDFQLLRWIRPKFEEIKIKQDPFSHA